MFLSNLLFCGVSYFLSEHKSLFIPIGLYFIKRHVWRVNYFFIKRLIKIETSSTFLNNHQKILIFEFSLRKFQNLNFYFIKQYSPNSNIVFTTYPYIYLYIQQFAPKKTSIFISSSLSLLNIVDCVRKNSNNIPQTANLQYSFSSSTLSVSYIEFFSMVKRFL